ncbi:hypothetical protein F66182_6059 [Fusarium sp. NRRL 66182]|nr:hypothetical protein F66182_6059 [Fusarium sp. NRRL 66182]
MPSKTVTARSLLGLPPELQRRIVWYLTAPTCFKSIHSLLYVCKQLYEIALPFSVHTYWGASLPWDPARAPRSRNRHLQFLRYILVTKPELAQHARTMILGSWPISGPEYNCDLQQDELEIYKDLIHATFPSQSQDDTQARAEWITALDECSQDTAVALLLFSCTRIKTLILGEPTEAEGLLRVLSTAARRNGSSDENMQGRFLTKLEDFYHESTETKYGYLEFHKQAQFVFQIPSIRSYECIMMNGPQRCSEELNRIPRRSSNIESIFVRRSCSSPATLHSLVGACRSLREFEYTSGVYHMYEMEMTPRDVLEALLPHAESLEYLYVNLEETWDKLGWEEDPSRTYMGVELRQMVKLKRLTVGSQTICGLLDDLYRLPFDSSQIENAPSLAQCLPEQLESLEIHSCGKPSLPVLAEFLETLRQKDRFQSLRSVKFAFNQGYIQQADIENLVSTRSGVVLEVMIQSEENRVYDLITRDATKRFGGHVTNICSRIWNPENREMWLKHRGGDKAQATVNGGVHKHPE